MTFNSVTFAIFFLAFLVVYRTTPKRWRNVVLLAGSYVFYGWWDWRFLALLAGSTIVDFTVAKRLDATTDERKRRLLLLTSLSVNLGILGVFKYLEFFADSASELLQFLGFEVDSVTLGIVLPVGISFYTFQTISYTFDVYRRRISATDDLVAFGTYVAYFPQLVAGPIERARRLLPQMIDVENRPTPDARAQRSAAHLILIGLVKKVVLADGIAHISDDAFAGSAELSWLALVMGVVAFAIQIYGDFSGYSDIARGVSRLLGIELVQNFAQPYLSRNITEFWRRWHMSLSDWLRDYLYIPLGGNRGSRAATHRNLMITMLLGGLWHGASWNFVVWGGLHGLFLVVHRVVRQGRVPDGDPRPGDIGSIVATNVAVLFAWVFFRAADFREATDLLGGIATLRSGPVNTADVATVLLFVVAMLAIDLLERHRHRLERRGRDLLQLSPLAEGAVAGVSVVAILVFSGGAPVPFIYFQF